jgi:TolA-binding protein
MNLIKYKYASVFVDEGNCAEALPILKDAADHLPQRYQVQFQAGYCFYKADDYAAAIRYFERSLLAWPASEKQSGSLHDLLIALGDSYTKSENLQGAAGAYSRLVSVFPDSPQGNLRLGRILAGLGRQQDAERFLLRGRELGALDSDPEGASPLVPREQ